MKGTKLFKILYTYMVVDVTMRDRSKSTPFRVLGNIRGNMQPMSYINVSNNRITIPIANFASTKPISPHVILI